MPSISLNKKRVLELVGKKLTDKELVERIPFLGTDLDAVTFDTIDVEIFPNRPDLLSTEGFSRAFSAFIGHKTGLPEYKVNKTTGKDEYKVIVKKEVKDVRPFTACAVVKNLKMTEEKLLEIIEIQEKLHVTYGRNRKRCAIGIYPMEVIKWPITYTAKKPEAIKFIPLGESGFMNGNEILEEHDKGKDYAYLLYGQKKYPIFVDAANEVLSMPPIINSDITGKITEKTKDVFIECSGFDYNVLSKAVNMIVSALSDMGGEIYSVNIKYEHGDNGVLPGSFRNTVISPDMTPEKIKVKKEYVEKILGLKLSDKDFVSCLKKMNMTATKKGKNFEVSYPCYRSDILHPVDIAEDVAIGYGYNNIPEDNNYVYSTGGESSLEKLKRKIREILVGFGLIETNNYSLVSHELQEKVLKNEKDLVKIKNSVSSEYDSLRNSLIISLLNSLRNNKHHEYPQNFFETDTIFTKDEDCETRIREDAILGGVFCSEKADFTIAKQHLDGLFKSLDIKYEVEKANTPYLIPGRSARIIVEGNNKEKKDIGIIGEIHPETLTAFELEVPASFFEVNIDYLNELIKKNN